MTKTVREVDLIKGLLERFNNEFYLIYDAGDDTGKDIKNNILSFLETEIKKLIVEERREIIYILKQQKPICAGSCGSGCEYLVEKLIKELLVPKDKKR